MKSELKNCREGCHIKIVTKLKYRILALENIRSFWSRRDRILSQVDNKKCTEKLPRRLSNQDCHGTEIPYPPGGGGHSLIWAVRGSATG